MKRILIKKGKVLDFNLNEEKEVDILVENDVIRRVGSDISDVKAEKIINAEGLYVLPGLIDVHAHLREPGFEYKEDIETGSKAAINGGVTTLFAMPNTNPAIDTRSSVEYVIKRAKEAGYIDIFPIGAITRDREGRELAEMGDMKDGGAIAFSDDGDWVRNSSLMRRALEYARAFDAIIVSHAEDRTLSNGVVHESYISYEMGLEGIPRSQEDIAIFRDVRFAEMTGGSLHIAHVSSKGAVKIIENAKRRGVKVSAEVTPNHLVLNQEDIDLFNPLYKVNPPIREREDKEALLKGLKEGVIDIIATDHAPHNWYEKNTDFISAPFGMVALDFYFSLLFTELVLKEKLEFSILVRATTLNPARLFGLSDRGEIKAGKKADIALFDSSQEYVLSEGFIKSKSKNTPFIGKKLRGRFVKVIKNGKVYNTKEI